MWGNVTYSLDSDGVLTISGSGDMYNYPILGELYEDSPFRGDYDIKKLLLKMG